MSELSDQLRVRVLEVLALTADGEAQCNYQAQAPHVDVAAELFNQWDEVYFPTSQEFRSAFSDEQLAALARYSRIIEEISTQTPQQLPPLADFMRTTAWKRLSDAANNALMCPVSP